MIYEWAGNYSSERRIDQQAFCRFRLDPDDSYRILFDRDTCLQLIGSAGLPGLFVSHTGQMWSAMDKDNDTHEQACGTFYSGTPFWYYSCWSGSINGGGEHYGRDHKNGAYWKSSEREFAANQPSNSAIGAGSGWIYIRPSGAGH